MPKRPYNAPDAPNGLPGDDERDKADNPYGSRRICGRTTWASLKLSPKRERIRSHKTAPLTGTVLRAVPSANSPAFALAL